MDCRSLDSCNTRNTCSSSSSYIAALQCMLPSSLDYSGKAAPVSFESAYQKRLKLQDMNLHHCAEELGSESAADYSSYQAASSAMAISCRRTHSFDCRTSSDSVVDIQPPLFAAHGSPSTATDSLATRNYTSSDDGNSSPIVDASLDCSAPPLSQNTSSNHDPIIQRRNCKPSFPPPLYHSLPPEIDSEDAACCTALRAFREEGRLILRQIVTPCRRYLHAHRSDGRLTLRLLTRTIMPETEGGLPESTSPIVEYSEAPPPLPLFRGSNVRAPTSGSAANDDDDETDLAALSDLYARPSIYIREPILLKRSVDVPRATLMRIMHDLTANSRQFGADRCFWQTAMAHCRSMEKGEETDELERKAAEACKIWHQLQGLQRMGMEDMEEEERGGGGGALMAAEEEEEEEEEVIMRALQIVVAAAEMSRRGGGGGAASNSLHLIHLRSHVFCHTIPITNY